MDVNVNVTTLLSPLIAAQLVNAAETKQLVQHLRGEPIDAETAMKTTLLDFASCWNKLQEAFSHGGEIPAGIVTLTSGGLHLVRSEMSREEGDKGS